MKRVNVLRLLMVMGVFSLWQTAGAEECPVLEHNCYYDDSGDFVFSVKSLSPRSSLDTKYRITFKNSASIEIIPDPQKWEDHPSYPPSCDGVSPRKQMAKCSKLEAHKILRIAKTAAAIDEFQVCSWPHHISNIKFELIQTNTSTSGSVTGTKTQMLGSPDGMHIAHIDSQKRTVSCTKMPVEQ